MVESHEDINVDSKFLQVLKLSFEVKNSQMKLSKTKKKIKTLQAKMEDLFQSTTMTTNVTLDNIIVLAIAYFNMGLIHVDSKEENELCAGKNYFMRCMELLKGKELDRKAILTSIQVYVKLQCILNKLQKPKTSELLYEAMELYLKYTEEENRYPNPINIPSVLGIEEEEESNSRLLLDNLHLTTVDYLVKRYNHWPKNEDKIVIYIHNLLNKQIPETMKFQNVGCYYWALASIDLIQYFLWNHRFTEARHHLAAADYIMEEFHKFINKTTSSEYHTLMLDKYQNARANIARYWAFYGNKLLCSSKEKLYQRNDESCKTDNSKSESLSSEKNITDFLLFTDLEKDLENITSTITDTYVLNLNNAKTVFVNVLKWLNTAKSYFTVENDFVTYGRILLENFKAFKYLACFEHSKDNLIKIYKRQIEILEDAIKELHPKAKTKEELQICKIIHFELGIAYSTFSSINTERLDKFDKGLIININYANTNYNLDSETCQSMKNAIKHFTSYLNMS